MARAALVRLVLATVAVAGAIGLGFATPSAQADDLPAPCGYVEVGEDGTTTTETVVSYCKKQTCSGGIAVGPNPGGANGATWDYFACIDHM